MREYMKFYIDGKWVDPVTPKSLAVINPANEEVCGHISAGSAADVDKAVAAARRAFETSFQDQPAKSASSCCNACSPNITKRFGDTANAITEEMGARQSGAAGPGADRHGPHPHPASRC
jgi:aldehyde dehydrogenase (NAD+)